MGMFDKLGSAVNNKFDDMKRVKEEKEAYFLKNDEIVKSLVKTGSAGGSDYSDSDKIILLKPSLFSKTYAVNYDTIKAVRVDEQIKEVAQSQTKSKGKEKRKNVLGRAIVGTVLMPGVGTVLGAATAKKDSKGNSNTISTTSQEINRKIIITREAPFVDTIEMPFNDGLLYKIQSILDTPSQSEPSLNGDTLDNLLKLKSLLDSGVLTQEEFDSKKEEFMK